MTYTLYYSDIPHDLGTYERNVKPEGKISVSTRIFSLSCPRMMFFMNRNPSYSNREGSENAGKNWGVPHFSSAFLLPFPLPRLRLLRRLLIF